MCFFCLFIDVFLGMVNLRILVNFFNINDDFLIDVLVGSGIYGMLELVFMLMLMELEKDLSYGESLVE